MRKTASVILSIVFILAFWGSSVSFADTNTKTVRVGWYESPFNIIDESGRRSGYAYEYQQKIAAYTGWEYEYVEGTWTDLFGMLERGEIDIMSDVSYTKERAEDLSTLNGKRIGVTKNSIQTGI